MIGVNPTNMQHLIATVQPLAAEAGDWRDYPCLLWDRGLVYGYGQVSLGHTNHRVHRVAWEIAHGDIPAGLVVCHRCDVRNCYRPSHLFLGTQKDNIQDCVRKGRYRSPAKYSPGCMPRGEAHARAKLTTDTIRAIRELYAEGSLTQKEVGGRFGLRQSYIYKVVARQIWNHV